MAVFAHPDDETFGAGSTLARYASEGVDITVVCATRGEAGEIAPGSDTTPEVLGDIREAELRSAVKILGVQSLILLGYRDSGMTGSEDNKNPLAFINAPVSEVVGRLVGLIREYRPHVVITMDLQGGYGHPDHIRVAEVTTQAFREAAHPSVLSEGAAGLWIPGKLYYHAFPRSMMTRWFKHIRETTPSNAMAQLDPNTVGIPDEEITSVLDVSPYVELRISAAQSHHSQRSPFDVLPRELVLDALNKDCWVRVEPPWDGSAVETDLFAGL